MENPFNFSGHKNITDTTTTKINSNKGGKLKMDKKILLFGLVLFGIIGMSGSASAAQISANWSITPSFQNTTVQDSATGANHFFNLTVCARGIVISGVVNESIQQVNITLPTGFTYVSGTANGTNSTNTTFTNTSNVLVFGNDETLINATPSADRVIPNCTNLWFNASIAITTVVTTADIGVNGTNNTGEIVNNATTLNVRNVYFDRAIFTSTTNIDVYFTHNISTAGYSLFKSNKTGSWIATAATVSDINPKIVHLTVINLSASVIVAGSRTATTNVGAHALNISASAVNITYNSTHSPAFSLLNEATEQIIARNLISNFYTTMGNGSRYGYGTDSALTNRSLHANHTNNVTMAMNTGAYYDGAWSYWIQGRNTTNVWNNFTSPACVSKTSVASSYSINDIIADNANFQATNFSFSTSEYPVAVYIYNKSQCSGPYQLLELNLWADIYSLNVDTTATTVGTTRNVAVYVKNETGKVDSYINISGVEDNAGNLPSGGDTFQVQTTGWNIDVKPETAGNLTMRAVTSGGALLETQGILLTSAKAINVNQEQGTVTISYTSNPSNIYKYFVTNVTVNVTVLNESVLDYLSYGKCDWNLTLKAGNITISNASLGMASNMVNLTAMTYFNATFNSTQLSNFSRTTVPTGNVPINITILLDINNDTIWDYNTTSLAITQVQDATDIVILSATPTSQNISAGAINELRYTVKNKTNQNILFNITLTGVGTKFYNGSLITTSEVLTTYTEANDTGGGVVLNITPEQNGTLSVSIASGALTAATDTWRVYGTVLKRNEILPTLESKLTYNDTYRVTVPVLTRAGTEDYGGQVNISGGSWSIVTIGSGNRNISGSDSDGYTIYNFSLVPLTTGKLNFTFIGGDGNNATIVNAYEVLYIRNYTITVEYGGAAVTTLTEGLNNTVNITMTEGSTLVGGELTITYYNVSDRRIGTAITWGNVTENTTVRMSVPKTAAYITLEVSNATATRSGNITLQVDPPTISLSTALLVVNSTVSISKSSPSSIVLINGTSTNLTFSITAPQTAPLDILIYKNNISETLIANATGDTAVLQSANISNELLNSSGVNSTKLFVLINNTGGTGWNLLNITVTEPTIGRSKTAVPINTNTTVILNVTAYSQVVPGVRVNVTNSTGQNLAWNITDSSGSVTLILGPTATDTSRIWVNGVRQIELINATNKLAVDCPECAYIENEYRALNGSTYRIYVRPEGSATDIVINSKLTFTEPDLGGSQDSATSGYYDWTPDELGLWTIVASKSVGSWTSSDDFDVRVVSAFYTFTSVTPSVSSIVMNISNAFTVEVNGSSGGISTATVTLAGCGVSTSATTNSSGIASFTGVTANSTGNITVTASKSGYTNMTTTITVTGQSTFSVSVSPSAITVNTTKDVTVTVTDASTAANVSSANVSISGAGVTAASALTNANGTATLSSVIPTSTGNITVTVSKTNYTTSTATIPVAVGTLSISVSPTAIQVNTSKNVTVTVTDATTSDAVSSANVSISGAGVTAASELTNSSGIAVFTNVTPTTNATAITVTVTKTGSYTAGNATISVTTTPVTTTTSTTSTSTTTSTTTTTTTLPVMNVTLSPETMAAGTAYNLTVNVTNGTSAIENASVSATGAGITNVSGTTDANGTATLEMTPTEAGTITVTVTKTGFADAAGSVTVTTTSTTSTTTTSTSTTSTSTTSTSTSTTSTSTSSTSTTTSLGDICDLPGDYEPCDTVELGEVVDFIGLWSVGDPSAPLSAIIDLINAWAAD